MTGIELQFKKSKYPTALEKQVAHDLRGRTGGTCKYIDWRHAISNISMYAGLVGAKMCEVDIDYIGLYYPATGKSIKIYLKEQSPYKLKILGVEEQPEYYED